MNWAEAMVKAADLTRRHRIRVRVDGWRTSDGKWMYRTSWAYPYGSVKA